MFKMISLVVATLLFHITDVYGNLCCLGDDLIRENGTCIDGSEMKINSTCPFRIILNMDQCAISENGSLIILEGMDEFIPVDRFCLGRLDPAGNNVSVVCLPMLEDENKSYLGSVICSIFSVVCLILTIIVYLLVPKLRDLQGKCILIAMIGLALAFTSLSIVQLNPIEDRGACLFWAFSIYFTFFIAFFWLNVVAINMWRKTIIPNLFHHTDEFWFALYLIYGFGGPIVFLLTSIVTHNVEGGHIKPGFGDGTCFLNAPLPLWSYFYGPIAVLLVGNLILFIWSSVKLWMDVSQQSSRIKNLKYKCLLTLKLCLIMGVTWLFEVISYTFQNINDRLDYIWAITDYLNALQGVLIFLVLVVFRKKALRGLANVPRIGSKVPKLWERLDDGECSSDVEALSDGK